MLLLQILPNFTVSGGFIISEKPELTFVSICSQTTFHSVHGKVRDCEPFPPGIWQSCTEDPPCTDSFCKSAPVSLPVGKNRAHLTQVVLQGDGRGCVSQGLKTSQKPWNWRFTLEFFSYLCHFHKHCAQNCVCIGAWESVQRFKI